MEPDIFAWCPPQIGRTPGKFKIIYLAWNSSDAGFKTLFAWGVGHGVPHAKCPIAVENCFIFHSSGKMWSHEWVYPTVGKKCINVPIPSDYYYFLLFRLATFTLWNLTYVGSKGGDFQKSFSSTWGAGFMKSPSCRVFWHFPLFKYTILRYWFYYILILHIYQNYFTIVM